MLSQDQVAIVGAINWIDIQETFLRGILVMILGHGNILGFKRLMSLVLLFGLATHFNVLPAKAQMIDEELLKQLQEQQGVTPTTTERLSPIDMAREDDEKDDERKEAREAARLAAATISRVELDYRQRLGVDPDEIIETDFDDLRQFGYEIFSQVSLGTGYATGQVSNNYVLGIGDEIVVSFVGTQERSITTKVDREGRVVLTDLPPIAAAGRTMGDFTAELVRRVSQAMLGTQVYVSVGTVRQIGVYVLGEVSIPGLHNITNMSSILQALAVAGGVKKTGSLRGIRVESNDGSEAIDLYALMESGTGAIRPLAEGDRIIVPPLGDTVAVVGEVGRPAIYELSPHGEGINWQQLSRRAGGTLRPRGNDVYVNRIDDNGYQSLFEIASEATRLMAGDIVMVSFKRDIIIGEVILEGHVNVEGPRPLASNPTISALIKGRDGLGAQPYLLFAILETTDDSTQARILKNVNLERILNGAEDIQLKDKDRLVVLSAEDIGFMASTQMRNTILTGKYEQDVCKSLTRLASLVSDAGNTRFDIVSRNVFVRPDSQNAINARERKEAEERASLAAANNAPRNMRAIEDDLNSRPSSASNVAGVVSTSEVLNANDIADSSECGGVFEKNVDFLPYTIDYAVAVNGSVQRPGVYPVSGETSLQSIVSVSGGLGVRADISAVELTTRNSSFSSDSASTVRTTLNLSIRPIDTIALSGGSTVRFNEVRSDQEPGTVLLSGELVRPGVYTLTRGETLGQVLERAGGITDYAYPFAGIFTRVSAKEEQEKAFDRAAREINSALAVAAIRSESSADAIVAAQDLVGELSSAEALGRIVVEVDPAVLRVRPELDTILEPGDHLHIPKRPNFVTVAGDVLNPGALQFVSGKTVNSYLQETGGFSAAADDDRVFLVYPNGVAQPVSFSLWASSELLVPPGSTIVVPKNLDPFTTLDKVTGITAILSQLALSAASIAVIAQ